MGDLRTILHVDMDAFFASVEQRDEPAWRGQPVLVGFDGPRGVVAAASYEARKFGCKSAMPMAVAKRLCPQAIIAPVRGGRYREVSRQVFGVFERCAPVVEPLSVDEAFLDVTGTARLYGGAPDFGTQIARQIKQAIRRETELTASVGVARNKFLAKLASDLHKPDGLTVLLDDEAERVLPGLSVGAIFGIGPKTVARLEAIGVRTIADLRQMPAEQLAARLGTSGEYLEQLAFGHDERPVCPDHGAKSISHEETFETDLGDPDAVREVLLRQVEAVGERLRRHGLFARRVGLKIRYGDFVTISRSRTLERATQHTDELWQAAAATFDGWARGQFRPVRLIGMGAEALGGPEPQMELFGQAEEAKRGKVDSAVDAINRKFGGRIVKRGGAG